MVGKVGKCIVQPRNGGFCIRYLYCRKSGMKGVRKWDQDVYSSRSEAENAIYALVERINTSGLNGTAKRAYTKNDVIVPKMSKYEEQNYNKIKQQLGLKNLTRKDWHTHDDLVNVSKLEDLTRRAKHRLQFEFNPVFKMYRAPQAVYDKLNYKSAYDCIRYLEGKHNLLRQRAEEYETLAKTLESHINNHTLADLVLVAEIEDAEDCDCAAVEFKQK